MTSASGPAAAWDLPARVDAPAHARRLALELLGGGDEPDLDDLGDVIGDVLVVVSELVTNAVIHAKSASRLVLEVHDTYIRIGVQDFGPGDPHVRQPDATGGRGLRVVEELAGGWEVRREDEPRPSKTVWCSLAR